MRELLGMQKTQDGARTVKQPTQALANVAAAESVSSHRAAESMSWESAHEAA